MAGPASTVDSPSGAFAPPRTPTRPDRARARRAWWFVIRRGLRLVFGPLVLAVCVTLVLGLEDRVQMAMAWASGVLIWLPTTVIQFRVAFFPSAPDPWLSGEDGPVSDRDLRAVYRSEVAEFVLGSLPPLWLATWFATNPQIPSGAGFGLAIALSLVLVARDLQVTTALVLHEASLDLAAGNADRARRWLERAMRWPLPGLGDRARMLLARARFHTGDTDGALAVLDRIRRPGAWQVEPVRAQMAIGRDGSASARAVAARLRADPEQRTVAEALDALADLYDEREDLVVARADTLLALPRGEARRVVLLLLAAAVARTDAVRARHLLVETRWDPQLARTLAAPWPPVAARLRALDPGGSR